MEDYTALKNELLARHSIRYKIVTFIFDNKIRLIFFTLLGIVTAVFIVAALLANKGTFTVTIPRETMLNLGLVISDTPDFARPRHEIQAPPVIDMWNITRSGIPDNINMKNGFNSGENYFAMTFYLKNMGNKDLDYTVSLDLNEIFNNLDEALRIELYLNDESTIYAKRAMNGEPEPGTVPFMAKTRIISLQPKEIKVNQVEKFTVVAWVEGEDPDCTNDLLGGFVKMTMNFDAKVKN